MFLGIALLVVSMVLGVMGVLFEGRDKHADRLRGPGVFMIVGIVTAALLGMAQQIADAAHRNLEEEASKRLAATQASAMTKALQNIERGLQPLSADFFVTLQYEFPCATLSRTASRYFCSRQAIPWRSLELAPPSIRRELQDHFVPRFELRLFEEDGKVEYSTNPSGTPTYSAPDVVAVLRRAAPFEELQTQSFGGDLRVKVTRAVLETHSATGVLVSAKDLDGAVAGVLLPRLPNSKVLTLEVATRGGYIFDIGKDTGLSHRHDLWVGVLTARRYDDDL